MNLEDVALELRDAVVDQLWTAVDIAEAYGFASQTTAHTYAARHADFPRPLKRFGRIDVYWAPDVRAWFDRPRPRRALVAS